MSASEANAEAVAFSRRGSPELGEFEEAEDPRRLSEMCPRIFG
jgi:hypothetical protein